MMEHLFKAWPSCVAALRAAPHVLLLSDYDGTLTPIVGRPEDARLSPAVREKLRILSQLGGVSLGVISGRSLAETRSMVGIDGIYYVGNHGLEIEGPGISFISPPAELARVTMKELAAELAEALRGITGVIVQDKTLSLSVHYRLVRPDDEKTVAGIVKKITGPAVREKKIKLFTGKKIWEIRPPVDWDKGKAVETIRRRVMSARHLDTVLTIYLGDDLTDEDAFRTLRSPEGWGIYIGGEKADSAAKYYLESPGEVEELLTRMIEIFPVPAI
ncbi:MAG: trehalose-phosphatase [Chloroflexi bacterium RBG_16_56_11]|nr:MAG: trehalose-phosphatase [Chloroflexi bacterium RBG_16_56_11]